jgi:hypothetical protein
MARPKLRTGWPVRCTAVVLSGSVVRFTCPEGHSWREDMNRKSLPVAKRVGAHGVRFLVKYWSGTGGVNAVCRKCAQPRESRGQL